MESRRDGGGSADGGSMHCGAGCLVVVVDAVAVLDSDGIAGFVARQHNATCLEGNHNYNYHGRVSTMATTCTPSSVKKRLVEPSAPPWRQYCKKKKKKKK
jgi:hypothetical protein